MEKEGFNGRIKDDGVLCVVLAVCCVGYDFIVLYNDVT